MGLRYRSGFALTALLFTTATAWAQPTHRLALETHNREIWRGETAGSQATFSLDRGDVSDGDTRRDLIAGAPFWNNQTGRVYVLFAGPVFHGENSFANAPVLLTGAAQGDRFGHATAAGYITGAELDRPMPPRDLVVGAPGANGGAGAVYMFLRGINADLGAGDAHLTVTGAPAGAQLGHALATGDLTGDGYREIIIGAPGIGAVYVVRGGPALSGTIDLSAPSSSYFRIQGSAADGVGRALASGDLSGHRVNGGVTYDLAISAHNEHGIGAVYLIFGRASGSFPDVLDLATQHDARFGGIDAGDGAGWGLAIDPFDTDTVSDLVISAPNGDGPGNSRSQAGEVYVIWGRANLGSRSLTAADLTIFGAGSNHQLGTDIATGNIDRLRGDDILMVASGASAGGEIHAVHSRARSSFGAVLDLAVSPIDRRVIGDPAAGVLRTVVAVDMSGDAADDIGAGIPLSAQGLLYISYSRLPPAGAPRVGDFNGDGSADLAVFDRRTATWSVRDQFTEQFGQSGDLPVAGDYDGDGDTDVAVYRPSTGSWIVKDQFTLTFGDRGDVPMPGDYNGDGVSDIAVYRPRTGEWFVRNQFTATWGGAGYVAVPGDYNGDGATDVAVYQVSTGMWYVRNYIAISHGGVGYLPVPGDYNRDGKIDIAVYQPATGLWYVRGMSGVVWGVPGDRPVPRDYDGDGDTDMAVFRPSTGTWLVRGQADRQHGTGAALPVPLAQFGARVTAGDYDGDAVADVAVYRPSTQTWFVRNKMAVQFGVSGDLPVPGDYDGDGVIDVAVYRPSTGQWIVRNLFTVQLGASSDVAVPGDYNGDGVTDVAVYRPSTGVWTVHGQFTVQFGDPGDVAVPGDYNGDGVTDIAIYRPSNGMWYVRNVLGAQFGDPGDVPVAADYNGDGVTDIAVYRPSSGHWFVRNLLAVQFGDASDKPVFADFNGDGAADLGVYRPSTGMWYIRNLFSVQFGDNGDMPVVRIGNH